MELQQQVLQLQIQQQQSAESTATMMFIQWKKKAKKTSLPRLELLKFIINTTCRMH
jgi:hypothetical protein